MTAPTAPELETRSLQMEIRAVDTDQRTITGIAVPWDDEIELFPGYREKFARGAVEDSDDAKLFWSHREVIGRVTATRDTETGWEITARISSTPRGDEVYTLLRDSVIDRMSVGFQPIESTHNEETDVHTITRARVREVSLVPFPAYEAATVTNVRQKEESTMSTVTAPTATVESVTELREAIEDLERSMDTRLTEISTRDDSAPVETRSAGELVKAAINGDEGALNTLSEVHKRAYPEGGGTSADTIARNAWIGDLTRLVDEAATLRGLFSTGTLPESGNFLEYGVLESNTVTVAEQEAEGDDLTLGKVTLDTDTAPVKTYGGYSMLTRQQIERSSVAILDHHFRAQSIAAGKALNAAFRTFYAAQVAAQITADNTVAVPASGTATYTDWLESVVDAAEKYEDLGLSIDALVVDKTIFKEFVGFEGSDGRPLFTYTGTGTNVVGSLDVKALQGDLANIPVRLNAKQANPGAAFRQPAGDPVLQLRADPAAGRERGEPQQGVLGLPLQCPGGGDPLRDRAGGPLRRVTPTMALSITVTPQELIHYVGGNEATDATFATEKVAEATELISGYIGRCAVPGPVLRGAVLEVGSKLWSRRSAGGNEAQFDTIEGAPVMPARDPMVTVYATLDRYLSGGFA